jgi:nucleoside-diphosphate-sugar epimerase
VPNNILVTGGAGYIGSWLVPLLLERKYGVVVLDTMKWQEDSLAPYKNNPRLKIVRGDINDADILKKQIKGIDYVVHLAANVGVDACKEDERAAWQTNVDATRLLIEQAQHNRVKGFIFASTCSVYKPTDYICTEDAERGGLTVYGDTKAAAEDIVVTSSIPSTILRFGTLVGPSQGQPRPYLTINVFVENALKGEHVEIHSADSYRPYAYVQDVVDAIDFVLQKPKLGIFNVAAENLTKRQVIDLIKQRVQTADFLYVNNGDALDPRNYRVSSEKFGSTYFWQPKVSVEEAIDELVRIEASRKILKRPIL